MKIKSFFKNLLFTFIAEGLVLLSFFLIYRIIAHNYGAQGAGEYSLIKKVFGFLHPIFILGIGVGLPRYIALAINREDRRDFVRAGFFSIIISCGVFLLFANIFKVFFASVFFGAPEYAEMVVPFSFFFAGLAMHGLVYSYFRGRMMAKLFNLLQLINLAIIPVLVLFLFNQHSLNVAMSVIGVLVFLVAIVFMTPFWGDLIKPGKGLKNAFGKLMRYSVPRVPGDFLMAAFFSLPIIGAAHFVSVEGAGYLSIGQGVIVAIATMLAPFGVLLLPKVSSLMAVGRENDVNINLNLFIRAILDGSLFVMVQIMIFADTIILFWLGPEFLPAAAPMRIMAISILSYAFYVSTRSVIDGAQSKPLNSINAFVSLAVALFLAAILFLHQEQCELLI